MEILPKTLIEKRKNKGLSQREVADFVGISQAVYAKYESGFTKPKYDKIEKLNEILELGLKTKVINSQDPITKGVPIFDIEFSAGNSFSILEAREQCFPIGYLDIPEVKGCDLIARARGNSMPGVVEDGDWMGLKCLNDWKEWFPKNYPYAIVTREQLLVKYAKRIKQADFITIISTNKEYEDDEIPVKLILEMWQVRIVFPFSKIQTFI